jgi:thiamine pyrophosphate-dependent acetolactate synthase large subunit-like protein
LKFEIKERSMAMAMTAADVLIESLIDWGVDVVFGLPGDGINGVMESLRYLLPATICSKPERGR